MKIEYKPMANEEAARAVASKTAVGRAVFDRLLPELKARAFVVTGLEDLRMVRQVRDAIAELPKGQSWEKVSKQVREKLEAGGFSPEAAAGRAELLVRHHGFQAYAEADWRAKQETKGSLPYWKYQTMGDGHVRSSHAALDGLVLPADDPFWKDHYPPWEWGCRCQVVAIDADEFQEIVDAGRVAGDTGFTGSEQQKTEGWTLGPKGRKALEKGTLDDGTGHPVDVRSPRAAKGSGAYGWTPGESSMKASDLHRRYAEGAGKDAERDWEGFYRQMEGVIIEDEQGRKRPIWDWVIRGDVMAAAGEARAIAQDKKVEAAVTLDYKTGERYGGTVTGTEYRVNNQETLERALYEERELAVVHTHPRESIPSPGDVDLALNAPQVLKLCVMTTPSGRMHVFRRPAEAEGPYFDFMVEMAQKWGENFDENGWKDALSELKESGVMDYETY